MNQQLEDGEDEILKMGDKENIEYQDYGIESIKDASYKQFQNVEYQYYKIEIPD